MQDRGIAPKPTRSHDHLQEMPRRDCQINTDDKDGNDEQEALFLREKIVEVAREGDTSEMEYLLGVSIARKLLTAVDKVSSAINAAALRVLQLHTLVL